MKTSDCTMSARIRHLCVSLLCLCASVFLASCAGSGVAMMGDEMEPAVDPVMGDWQGHVVQADGRVVPVVAQVIAYDDGKYVANLFSRFDVRERPLLSLEGQNDRGTVRFVATAGEGSGQVSTIGGEITGEIRGPVAGKFALRRVVRRAPTLAARPPEGALVLFDGSSLAAWSGADGQASEARWTVHDGYMEVKAKAGGIVTRKKFTNFQLHLEFRTPFMPEAQGQGRGNSGVYLQGRYEVQVLDSYGLEGRDNECGGVYQLAAPAVNMCAPPGQWQSYDITFTAPRFDATGNTVQDASLTVLHNGFLIHDGLRLPAPTPGGIDQDVKAPGGIMLQDHGNPVQYRNIWLVELPGNR